MMNTSERHLASKTLLQLFRVIDNVSRIYLYILCFVYMDDVTKHYGHTDNLLLNVLPSLKPSPNHFVNETAHDHI